MHETTCGCGATVLGHHRFCGSCGAPAAKLPEPLQEWDELDPRVEAALRTAMADIDDGHLGLWLAPGTVTADRVVPAVLNGIDWPLLLQQRGWVRAIPGTQRRLWPTDAGREVASLARAERSRLRATAGPDL